MSARTDPDHPSTASDGGRHPGLKQLERLVGTWKMSGETQGEIRYEWFPGKHFLIARGRIDQLGKITEHIEIIGYDKPMGAEKPSDVLTSRLYTNSGDTLVYTHEIDDKTPELALTLLESYRARYRPVAAAAGMADEFDAAGALKVVEEKVGTGST